MTMYEAQYSKLIDVRELFSICIMLINVSVTKYPNKSLLWKERAYFHLQFQVIVIHSGRSLKQLPTSYLQSRADEINTCVLPLYSYTVQDALSRNHITQS